MLEVGPLSFSDCARFHPGMDPKDHVRLYLTVGGVPRYHLDTSVRTYREYVERHFLSDTADLADEALSLISAEFAPRDRYLAVINAITDGAASVNAIKEHTGLERTTCKRCLDSLESIWMIDRRKPMFGSLKGESYRIREPVVAFCRTVVRESRAYSLTSPSKRTTR